MMVAIIYENQKEGLDKYSNNGRIRVEFKDYENKLLELMKKEKVKQNT